MGFEVLADEGVEQFALVVECAGSSASFTVAVSNLRTGGTIAVIAMSARDVAVPLNALNVKEATVLGTHLYTSVDFETVVERMRAGLIDTTGWTADVELDDVVRTLHGLKKGELIKALVRL